MRKELIGNHTIEDILDPNSGGGVSKIKDRTITVLVSKGQEWSKGTPPHLKGEVSFGGYLGNLPSGVVHIIPKIENSDESSIEAEANLLGISDDTKREFSDLVEKWKKETRHMSSPEDRYRNDNYLLILTLASRNILLSLILNDLQVNRGFWFEALRILSRQSVVKKSDWGNIDNMREAWLTWGVKNGYLEK